MIFLWQWCVVKADEELSVFVILCQEEYATEYVVFFFFYLGLTKGSVLYLC